VSDESVIKLYVDNKAAVLAAKDGGYYPKLKHVNRKHKFIMYAAQEHNVDVCWISGEKNPADVLTKALGGPQLRAFRDLVFHNTSV
jgi:hypothetical protein